MRTYDEASWLWLCRYAFDLAVKIGGPIPPSVVFGGRRRMGRELTVVRERLVCNLRKTVVMRQFGGVVTFCPSTNVVCHVRIGDDGPSFGPSRPVADDGFVPISQPIIAELMGYRDHSAVNLILRKHGMGVRNQPMDAGALSEIQAGRPLDDGEI